MNINMAAIERTRALVLRKYSTVPPLGLESEKTGIGAVELPVLSSIWADPFMGVDVRASMLNMSSPMLRRIVGGLAGRGWVQLVPFSFRKRGYAKFPNITADGLKISKLEMPNQGTGSFLHRKIQALLKGHFKKLGFDPRIEFDLSGKRADVAFIADGKHVAIEVGLNSDERESENITKDFAAGYAEVRSLCRDSGMIERIKQHVGDQEEGLLKVELITEYFNSAAPETETSVD